MKWIIFACLAGLLLLVGCTGMPNPPGGNQTGNGSNNNSWNNQTNGTGNATLAHAEAVARLWLTTRAPTYTFDGIPSTLQLVGHWDYIAFPMIACPMGGDCRQPCLNGCPVLVYEYDSAHGGYGNREGQVLSQVITHHRTEVWVNPANGTILRAVTDGVFDEKSGYMGAEPPPMTREVCEAAHGHWNECASACRGAPDGTACIMMCVMQCECGGIAGWSCPAGYECTDYLPSKDTPDAMGVCKRI